MDWPGASRSLQMGLRRCARERRGLGRLSRGLGNEGLAGSVPVITDGLPPRSPSGTWISLFSPEAAASGVIGWLRDGDALRISFEEGRIRTGVGAQEFT